MDKLTKFLKRLGTGFLLLVGLIGVIAIAIGLLSCLILCVDDLHKNGWTWSAQNWIFLIFSVVVTGIASYHLVDDPNDK